MATYLEAYDSGLLARRIRRALAWLSRCTLCPRMCRANRLKGEMGFCRTGRHAVVGSHGPHFGEERPLVGTSGSGTIFFSHCNLLCVFCQNFDLSHLGHGREVSPEGLAEMMIQLQDMGCHNINLVTPTHVLPQILEALPVAIEKGLTIPLVYNCGGYERVPALRLLDGIVDIYMPDFKFWESRVAERLCEAPDYPSRARRALLEMHRQVGELILDRRGIARKGLLVRHLVMPSGLSGTVHVMRFIATEISPNTYVNVMDQYRPCGGAVHYPKIARGIEAEEYISALRSALDAGLQRLDERCRARALWW